MPAASKKKLPDWAAETPNPITYEIAMWNKDEGECYQQMDDLTREEYVKLKLYLAKLRDQRRK